MNKQEFLDNWAPYLSPDNLSEINTCLFYYCRNNCTFCIHWDKLDSVVGFNADALEKKLQIFKELIPKCRNQKVLLVLIGGEIFSHVPKHFWDMYRRFYHEVTEVAEKHGKKFVIEFCSNMQAANPDPIISLLNDCENTMITTSYDETLRGNNLVNYKRNLGLFKDRIAAVVSLTLEESMRVLLRHEMGSLFNYIYDNFLTVYEPYIEVKPLPKTQEYQTTYKMWKEMMAKYYPKTIIIDSVKCNGQEFFVFPESMTLNDVKEVADSADAFQFSQGINKVLQRG